MQTRCGCRTKIYILFACLLMSSMTSIYVLQGVVMGPLVMMLLIAARDLYFEFVLKVLNEYEMDSEK